MKIKPIKPKIRFWNSTAFDMVTLVLAVCWNLTVYLDCSPDPSNHLGMIFFTMALDLVYCTVMLGKRL
jgi:hypothetical protein